MVSMIAATQRTLVRLTDIQYVLWVLDGRQEQLILQCHDHEVMAGEVR